MWAESVPAWGIGKEITVKRESAQRIAKMEHPVLTTNAYVQSAGQEIFVTELRAFHTVRMAERANGQISASVRPGIRAPHARNHSAVLIAVWVEFVATMPR